MATEHADIFGKRFFAHRTPAWHKLGHVTDKDTTANEAFSILGGYWFEKRPVTVTVNGAPTETGDFAVIRSACPDDPTERVMGYATKAYHIIQPQDIVDMFDRSVTKPVETMGMLGGGQRMFVTWVLPEIDIKGDQVRLFGFIAAGYEPGLGVSLNVVSVRTVCRNTYRLALNEASQKKNKDAGQGQIYKGKHNSPNASRDLEIWMEHVQQQAEHRASAMKDLFNSFAAKPLNDTKTLADLLFQIYPDPEPVPGNFPMKLRDERQTRIDKAAELAARDRATVEGLFGGQGTAITADGWGLFNAVTEFENFGRKSKKEPEYSILFGERGNTMTRAASAIRDWASE